MEGLSPVFKWVKTLPYEIVERRFNSARIIVYCEGLDEKGLYVSHRGKRISIYGFGDGSHAYYLDLKLWFKVKEIEKLFRNGILTLEVKGYRLIPFPRI